MRLALLAFVRSFGFAFEGLFTLLRTQRNARVESLALVVVLTAGLYFSFSQTEWLAVVMISTLVLALEAINTALEDVVNLASPETHPLAKRAKDIAASAVLIAAMGALAIAAIVVSPRFMAWFARR